MRKGSKKQRLTFDIPSHYSTGGALSPELIKGATEIAGMVGGDSKKAEKVEKTGNTQLDFYNSQMQHADDVRGKVIGNTVGAAAGIVASIFAPPLAPAAFGLGKKLGTGASNLFSHGGDLNNKKKRGFLEEKEFRREYKKYSDATGNSSNPYDAEHYYNISKLYDETGGIMPNLSKDLHLPSRYKELGHPNRFINGVDTTKEYAEGGKLTYYNAGGTHEQNANGGVVLGNTGNSVEEGEYRMDDRVLSKKLGFADLMKKWENKSKLRPNDTLTKELIAQKFDKLYEHQEATKAQEQMMSQMALGGDLKSPYSVKDSTTIVNKADKDKNIYELKVSKKGDRLYQNGKEINFGGMNALTRDAIRLKLDRQRIASGIDPNDPTLYNIFKPRDNSIVEQAYGGTIDNGFTNSTPAVGRYANAGTVKKTEPKLDTSNWKQSSLDSLADYNDAVKYRKENLAQYSNIQSGPNKGFIPHKATPQEIKEFEAMMSSGRQGKSYKVDMSDPRVEWWRTGTGGLNGMWKLPKKPVGVQKKVEPIVETKPVQNETPVETAVERKPKNAISYEPKTTNLSGGKGQYVHYDAQGNAHVITEQEYKRLEGKVKHYTPSFKKGGFLNEHPNRYPMLQVGGRNVVNLRMPTPEEEKSQMFTNDVSVSPAEGIGIKTGVGPSFNYGNFNAGVNLSKAFTPGVSTPIEYGVNAGYQVNPNLSVNAAASKSGFNVGLVKKFEEGGYVVQRSSDRKGKTHKVTGPDGTEKYFGDSNLGQHPSDPERKEAFYARHKKNLDNNPYFRAYARKTWEEGGQLVIGGGVGVETEEEFFKRNPLGYDASMSSNENPNNPAPYSLPEGVVAPFIRRLPINLMPTLPTTGIKGGFQNEDKKLKENTTKYIDTTDKKTDTKYNVPQNKYSPLGMIAQAASPLYQGALGLLNKDTVNFEAPTLQGINPYYQARLQEAQINEQLNASRNAFRNNANTQGAYLAGMTNLGAIGADTAGRQIGEIYGQANQYNNSINNQNIAARVANANLNQDTRQREKDASRTAINMALQGAGQGIATGVKDKYAAQSNNLYNTEMSKVFKDLYKDFHRDANGNWVYNTPATTPATTPTSTPNTKKYGGSIYKRGGKLMNYC